MGEGINYKETLVAVWGGLRGALAIALALIIFTLKSEPDGVN